MIAVGCIVAPGITKFVITPAGSMRVTEAGPARCAIHLLPSESTVMPSGAVVVGYDATNVPAASNSCTPVPPLTQPWPAASNAIWNGLPSCEATGVIVRVTGSTMSNVPWMKRTTQILPSGATCALRRLVGIAMRCRTFPHGVTCMMSDDVRLAIQYVSWASAGMQRAMADAAKQMRCSTTTPPDRVWLERTFSQQREGHRSRRALSPQWACRARATVVVTAAGESPQTPL